MGIVMPSNGNDAREKGGGERSQLLKFLSSMGAGIWGWSVGGLVWLIGRGGKGSEWETTEAAPSFAVNAMVLGS